MLDLATIGIAFDTSGLASGEAALKSNQRAADAASDAIDRVSASARRSGEGFSALDASAARARSSLDGAARQTQDFIARLERQNATFNKTADEVRRYEASLLGATREQRAYIDQLLATASANERAAISTAGVASGMQKVGMSAAQMNAALRGVPAQFTDIFTSLASGQQPLTVFLQQGGQLKDMFGGAGPAAKALGGYVLGLITPLTLAAAAVGALGVAYLSGSKEAENYARAIIMTGNAAGVTVGQLQQMAQGISGSIGTQHAAAEALATMAQSGNIARENLQRFTEVAIRIEREIGQPVEKTAEQFKALADKPLEATLKLNDGLNYLTESTYKQIKALLELGDKEKAGEIAQVAYASAMQSRTQQLEANLGAVERATRAVIGAAKGMWDALLGVGRAQTGNEQLASLKRQLAAVQSDPETAAANPAYEQMLKSQIALLERIGKQTQDNAKLEGERVQIEQAGIRWGEIRSQYLTTQGRLLDDQAKKEIQIAAIRQAGKAAGKDEDEINKTVAAYEKLTASKKAAAASPGDGVIARLKQMIAEEERYLARLYERGSAAEKLTAGEKLQMQIEEQLSGAQKKTAAALADKLIGLEKARAAADTYNKAMDGAREANEKLIAGTAKNAEAINEQAGQQEAANAVFGKGKTAIEEMTLAQLRFAASQAESEGADQRYLSALYDRIRAQERLVQAYSGGDVKRMQQTLDEWSRSVREQANVYGDEARLAGLSAVERAKVIALRKVELDLAKRIADIDKQSYGDDEKERQRQQARQTAMLEGEAAVSKVVRDEWQKTSDSISQSLTDALLRGFESGKDFGKNFKDTLVNMFKTLVLKPVIQFVVNPISNAISGVISGFLGGGSGGGSLGAGTSGAGVLGLANNASSAYSLYNYGSALYRGGVNGAIANYAGSGSYLGYALGTSNIAPSAVAAANATADPIFALYGSQGWGSAAAGGTSAAAAGAATSYGTGAAVTAAGGEAALGGAAAAGAASGGTGAAVAGLSATGWGIIAAAAILAVMYFTQSKGGPKQEGGAGFGIADAMRRGDTKNAETISKGISDSYAALATQLGITNNKLDVGVFYAKDPKGDSNTQLQVIAGRDGRTLYQRAEIGDNRQYDPTFENVGRSDEDLQKAIAEATTRAIYAGIKDSDLGQKYKDWLNAQEELTRPAREAQAAAGGIDMNVLRQQFGDLAEEVAANMRLNGQSNMPGGSAGLEDPAVLQQRLQMVAAMKQFDDAISKLPFEGLKNMSWEATEALLRLTGGVQGLSAKLSSYYENYYSEAERTAITTKNVADSLSKLGLPMVQTRDQFRELVEAASKNLDTEAGRQAYNTLLELSQVFASITPVTGQLKDNAWLLNDALADLPFTQLMNMSNEAATALGKAAGGMDALAGKLSGFYGEYYSEAERAEFATRQLTGQFNALGLQMPQSRDELRRLVEQAMEPARLATEGGEEFLATLLKLAGAFAQITPKADAAAQNIASSRPASSVSAGDQAEAFYREQQAAQAAADKLKAFNDGLIALPFDHLSGLSDQARDALFGVAGGMDALSAKLNSYAQNFYTESERTAAQTKKLEAQFASLGLTMPRTREEFRALVDDAAERLNDMARQISVPSIDAGALQRGEISAEDSAAFFAEITGVASGQRQAAQDAADAGRKQYEALLSLADAFAQVVPATEAAVDSAQAWRDALAALPFDSLVNLSDDARNALLKVAGGMDALAGRLNSYYQNFYSEAERSAIAAQKLGEQFAVLGVSMPKSREEFRALVESAAQTLETSAGRTMYDALLRLADAFAQAVPAVNAVTESTSRYISTVSSGDLAEEFVKQQQQAASAANQAVDDALRGVEQAVAAQRKLLDVQRATAAETVNTIKGVFDLLESSVSDLYSQGGDGGQSAREGQAFIEQALATAQATGYLPERDDLQKAIAAARKGLDPGNFSSAQDMDRQRLILAGRLDSLREISGGRLSSAELQLKYAEEQIKALDAILENARAEVELFKGIDNSVKSVAEAVDRLHAAIAATKPAPRLPDVDLGDWFSRPEIQEAVARQIAQAAAAEPAPSAEPVIDFGPLPDLFSLYGGTRPAAQAAPADSQAMTDELAAIRAALFAMAASSEQTARASSATAETLDYLSNGGNALRTTAA